MANTLKVIRQPDGSPEVFFSVQGEGASAGVPAVFLRLAGCNLACRWCDTRYAWDWDPRDADRHAVHLSTEELAAAVQSYGCRRLVVTGGEPLLQARPLAPLLRHLQRRDYVVEVETNCTIVPEQALVEVVHQWNVSPKLENSGVPQPSRESPRCYELFRSLRRAWFKFVVREEADIAEVLALAGRYRLPPGRVMLMPEGRDAPQVLERSRWLAEACKRHGFRLSPRLHVLLWGGRRGV